MYGQHNSYHHSGGGGGGRNRPAAQPPAPPPQDPNLLLQNLILLFQNPNLFLQNPSFPFIQNPNLFAQDPNFLLQNHNFMVQNPNFLGQNPNFPVQSNFLPPQQIQSSSQNSIGAPHTAGQSVSNPSLPKNNNTETQQQSSSQKSSKAQKKIDRDAAKARYIGSVAKFPVPNKSLPPQKINNIESQPQSSSQNINKSLEKIDRAVTKVRRKLIAAGASVSAWNVSLAALLKLKVDSWSSLGFRMQEVPSLLQLMMAEGKINSFINCFVGVRRITSLYDLEVAICKNEGIKQFEELELGPLVRHPLVVHYFSVDSDVSAVYKISSEDVTSYLWEYMSTGKEKEIRAEEFLDFIAKKRSLMGRDELGVRIQSLGMHITFINEAKRLEDASLIKCLEEKLKQKSNNNRRKRPRFSEQKKLFDERFSAMCQRIKSFSSVNEDFDGKHIKFISSSSEDNDCGGEKYNSVGDDDVSDQGKFSSKSIQSCDRVSSCPYPSATEEMTRLGLKGEMDTHPSPASYSFKYDESSGPSKKKRKSESACTKSGPTKLAISADDENKNSELQISNEYDFSLANSRMRKFITIWKGACCDQTIFEVFDMMLRFYELTTRERKRIKSVFGTYPCFGLLVVAVTSIKRGMCKSMYDRFQAISRHGLSDVVSDTCPKYESIDVEPSAKNECISECRHSVTVEDIIRKITAYFELDHEVPSNGKSHLDKQFILLRKLCSCEVWLTEQFSVKEFKSLGHGEFIIFLQKYASLLPIVLLNSLVGDINEKSPFRVCMVENQLLVLLSQALNSSWEDEAITKEKIYVLLMRQFPSIGFSILENGSTEDFFDIVRDRRSSVISNCVLYSVTLSGTCDYGNSLAHNATDMSEISGLKTDFGQKMGSLGPVTSNDAIKVLLRAPMLSDLNTWSHWDLIFAPSLGPLVVWLSNEVNNKELLCLVTKDSKVIRINHSATLDSYLDASLQGSPFRTAVELLSLFSLFGGKRHVPLSLLKCHTRQAFKVILKNSVENMDVTDSRISLMHGKAYEEGAFDDGANNLNYDLNSSRINRAVPVASRFVLDCLAYLPSEFRCFAADVLLSGLRSFIKDAPSAILCECNQTEQRLMLHDIGLSLGIMEWIDDHYTFCSTSTDLLNPSRITYLKAPSSKFGGNSSFVHHAYDKLSSKGETRVSVEADCHTIVGAEVSSNKFGSGCLQNASELNEHKDAAFIIESIRREEFGLDTNVSETESRMLKKQHARLGRALHCLAQELYSQDSHFLLELVQNADDNIYLENVEPTLTFILRDTEIVVLNNERGFSADNIKALCDVGNSTKKGSGAGYIGQKGIGFKSVFRVTDAPEIHSNGFHVKFDISEGQIGFVLPTIVPSCNIDLLRKLASEDTDQLDASCWNTCIVLPFRTKLLEGTAMNSIMSMFSDLHPSLLLFLHRLRCIKFRNLLNNSLVVMRTEHVGDGIIKVSHGSEKMTWLAVYQKLQADAIRPDVQTTEIALAFTLDELENGDYVPHLELQPVFAFLPLRAYGLKFILQGDFILPSSREEVDGDSPWNQWLLSEYPDLFVSAEKSFCALPCFRENIGKAVSVYMSFVPLVGEVHGFFSSLPRMIISKLRMSNCLLLEGDSNTWVPPCKVIRNWNVRAHVLLTDSLLRGHLGLGFLEKNIALSDPLARALGIEEYGPKILLQIVSSLCRTEKGLESMGVGWLCSWLNELYTMSFHSSGKSSGSAEVESDVIDNLRKIPFIPLSDGTHVCVDDGTIWLHSDALSTGFDGEHGLDTFPNLYANLRTVNPALLASAADTISCQDTTLVDNITRILHRIGVQRLSAHEIIKVHILPSICDDRITKRDKSLMTEYLAFVMLHLQSGCLDCRIEREYILSELRSKAFILTSYGYKRPVEVPIHFGNQYANPIKVNNLIDATDLKWHELDVTYLSHPINNSLSSGLTKWREFFHELGVTDFINIVQLEKSITDISHTLLKNMMSDGELISLESIAKDWESDELIKLLSFLSLKSNRKKCMYMLEVLDTLWDSYSDKTTGYCHFKSRGDSKPFKSSFMSTICDVRWVVSSMDDELHYPKDLFHDCDSVRLVLGASAPYAVPKVKSEKLLGEIGFKTQVTLDDNLAILQVWRRSETPFMASIAQMSRFYTLIWSEMATSRQKIMRDFCSGPFIFVPYASGLRHDDIVPGIFLSPEDVYWHDSTGSMDQMKVISPLSEFNGGTSGPLSKTLSNVYPGLHDFFVNECGVHETPPFRNYLQILLQLSTITLPSQAATAVFQVFLKWADGLKCGLLSSEDIVHLKESLLKVEITVLPTIQDKWVSLHTSFGLVCWCDDECLTKEFKHSDNIDFIYFGELSNDEKEVLRAKISVLLQAIGIPSISEVVTREAIYYGLNDCSFKASLVNWALPYAQRYIFNKHPARYCQLKQSGFEILSNFRVSVVESLFCRNVIKRCDIVSKKHFECNSLLQRDILFTTAESDSHSIFMELSSLFFDGTPELHLANFLHMITTMVESGSNEDQLEFFILNSQKLPKLQDKDSVWSLSSGAASTENDEMLPASTNINEQNPSKSKSKRGINSNWPPVDWKTAPDFSFARANGFRTQAAVSQPSSSSYKKPRQNVDGIDPSVAPALPMEIDDTWTIKDGPALSRGGLILPDSETLKDQSDYPYKHTDSSVGVVFDPVDSSSVSEGQESGSSKFSKGDRLNTGNPNPAAQAMITGRLGEHIANKYFTEKIGKKAVKWVNEHNETGLPYDILIEEEGKTREYIEVKATRSTRKDWFIIKTREWQFAVEKGDSYSIAHVVLSGNNAARVAIFKNPFRLCQLRQLQLLVMMPKQQREYSIIS